MVINLFTKIFKCFNIRITSEYKTKSEKIL